MSQVGVATRTARANVREPAWVSAWISKKGRKQIQVRSGQIGKYWGHRYNRLSTKTASQYDDWEPLEPYTGTICLALSLEEHKRPRFHVDNRTKRQEYRRRRKARKAKYDDIAATLKESKKKQGR